VKSMNNNEHELTRAVRNRPDSTIIVRVYKEPTARIKGAIKGLHQRFRSLCGNQTSNTAFEVKFIPFFVF
jgi:hypothetical protein